MSDVGVQDQYACKEMELTLVFSHAAHMPSLL